MDTGVYRGGRGDGWGLCSILIPHTHAHTHTRTHTHTPAHTHTQWRTLSLRCVQRSRLLPSAGLSRTSCLLLLTCLHLLSPTPPACFINSHQFSIELPRQQIPTLTSPH